MDMPDEIVRFAREQRKTARFLRKQTGAATPRPGKREREAARDEKRAKVEAANVSPLREAPERAFIVAMERKARNVPVHLGALQSATRIRVENKPRANGGKWHWKP